MTDMNIKLPFSSLKLTNSIFNVEIGFESPVLLPSFKSSMLRGILGSSLKRFVCHNRGNDCAKCSFSAGCVYFSLFEPKRTGESSTLQNSYVIYCDDFSESFSPDKNLKFRVSLFGEAAQYGPYVVKALFDSSRKGLTVRRIPFRIIGIGSETGLPNDVYDGSNVELKNMVRVNDYVAGQCNHSAVLKFAMPFRTKVDGELINKFRTDAIVRAVINRLAGVGTISLDESHHLLRNTLNVFTENIKLISHDVRWVEYTRYSNRQQSKMKLGGVMGCCELSGTSLPILFPMLKICELAHIGKATTFGFGKYELEA